MARLYCSVAGLTAASDRTMEGACRRGCWPVAENLPLTSWLGRSWFGFRDAARRILSRAPPVLGTDMHASMDLMSSVWGPGGAGELRCESVLHLASDVPWTSTLQDRVTAQVRYGVPLVAAATATLR